MAEESPTSLPEALLLTPELPDARWPFDFCWYASPSGGQNMTLSDLRERPSGRERRAGKKAEPVPKDRLSQLLWLLGNLLQCLCCWLRLDLGSRPRFLLGGELMLDLEGNRIGVHLVRLGCGAENLTSVRLLAG